MISTAGRYRGPNRPRILPEPMERDPPIGRPSLRIRGGMGCRSRVPGPDLIDTRELQPRLPVWRRRSSLAVEAIESDDAVREILLALDMARRRASGGDG